MEGFTPIWKDCDLPNDELLEAREHGSHCLDRFAKGEAPVCVCGVYTVQRGEASSSISATLHREEKRQKEREETMPFA